MKKNIWENVAKALGISLEREFTIEEYGSDIVYKFTKHGLIQVDIDEAPPSIVLPLELYKKHKEEVEKSCEKVGAGIILIAEKELPNGHSYCYLETCAFAKKPKLRKAKPLTVYQKLKFARLGCLRWPSLWHHRNRQEHNTRSEDN